MKTSYMDRRTVDAIKGVALILMFVHHFFTYPEWYVSGIFYPALLPFVRFLQTPTRLCVGIFAFLTGYFYCFSREKTLGYSLKKIRDFLISYWVVYALLLALALALGCWKFSLPSFVQGLVGLNGKVMRFCWYVHFYILTMLLLPLLWKISAGNPVGDIGVMLVLPTVIFTTAQAVLERELGMETGIPVEILVQAGENFPSVAAGCLCARYGVFEGYFHRVTGQLKKPWAGKTVCLGLCIAAFFGRLVLPRIMMGSLHVSGKWTELAFNMDMVYAPVFVYGMAELLRDIPWEKFRRPLEAVGEKSMLMWFLHCVFFNCCRKYTQPLLYMLKNPILVLLSGLAVCYLAAVVIDVPLKKLLNRKKTTV